MSELHQIRYYDVANKLISKSNVSLYIEAVEQMKNRFQDQTVFRAVIRRLDSAINDWLVVSFDENINADWPEQPNGSIHLWKTTFYDAGDRIIFEKTSTHCPDQQENQLELLRLQALYCVLASAEDSSAPIINIQSNAAHTLYGNKAGEWHKRSGRLFELALAEDRDENERLGICVGKDGVELGNRLT